MDEKPQKTNPFAPSPALTGCAVTAIIILGMGDNVVWSVPLGFIAGAIATYGSSLSAYHEKEDQ